ncbi:MAG: DNA-directed RNA polymerase, partial [Planctomycetota bacterium]
AHTIGSRIEDEVRFSRFEKEDPRGYKNAMRLVKNSQDYGYKHKVMVHTMNSNTGVTPWLTWGMAARARIGALLLDVILDHPGIIEVVKLRGVQTITAHEELIEALAVGHETLEVLSPWYLPTLDVPTRWEGPRGGGYSGFELPLVKDRSQAYLDDLPEMPVVYFAVNALQETAWRVNPDVHATLQELWAQKYEVAGLPAREAILPPPRPEGLPPKGSDLTPVQFELLKAWKAGAARAANDDVRRKSKLVTAAKLLQVADMLAPHARFYFPHSLDWRGRAYALPLFLSPQGNDMSKGLLEFAEAKPLGTEDAAFWFATAGATRFGVDKVSLAARQDWVVEHEERVRSVASDPLTNLWWTEADEPWQFLAWCLEYSAWSETGYDLAFESRLAVGMDGSCNGLQHFSAMLRDEKGGAAVNLLPSDSPQDIYQRVADVVCDKVAAAALMAYPTFTREDGSTYREFRGTGGSWGGEIPEPPGHHIARQWAASGLLDRAIVKRQVMTLPYGATKHGMQQQLMDYLAEVRDKKFGGELPLENVWDAALWLTNVIFDSIGEVVVAAREAQAWLQNAARLASAKESPIRWTAPNGFPVEQKYLNHRRVRVKTQLMGTVQLRMRKELETLDKRKQVAGISPNFIHSLDAAHMMLTVSAMGPGPSWAMVHDSYGCHAADAPRLAGTLRREFVQMYQRDVLVEFGLDLVRNCSVSPGVPPPMGDLDLTEVLRAEFFFA